MSADWKANPSSHEYDETRARLLAAATEIVTAAGVAALRLDAVAARAGLHRSSVYRYFDSKEAIVTELVVGLSLGVADEVTADLDPDDPAELLVEGIIRSLTAMASHPVHRSLQDPSNSASVARLANSVLAEAMRPLVAPMIDAAERRGVLRDGVTADDAIRWLMIVSSGLTRWPDLFEDEDALRTALQTMLVPALLDDE